ncbi:variable surface protein [Plasmodium gonderi]|uniref:Variable surface protein n=1 Tax=Plasmodium gonderi TaxID=77519 RepID=A0A1Y1JSG2_PLAGO|nr:variable surface protein [Plasmodium gonderi]GAW84395.1 variable surface protein [Plasmodium gonderi]
MDNATTKEKIFDFTGIFPNCRNDFNNCWERRLRDLRQIYNQYSPVCRDYQNDIRAYHVGNQDFQTDCIALGLYLNFIDDKKKSSVEKLYLEASCKYFFYKLKHLVHKHKGTCHNTVECYNEFIKKNEKKDVHRISVPQICLQYANNNDIDEYTFKILGQLDNLYDLIEIFKKREHRTYTNVKKFDSNINNLEKYSATYNKSLNEELEKIFKVFKDFFNTWSTCWYGKSALPYFSNKWRDRKTFRGTEKIRNEITRVNTSTEISASIGTRTSTGTSTGVIFFCFAIIPILFILYKYISYGSFLQPSVRKLKRRFNKKNRYHQNLMDSFHGKKHNLNYNDYRIACISED